MPTAERPEAVVPNGVRPPQRGRAVSGSWRDWTSPEIPVRIGVSSCLLGEAVRYDGGHKRDRFLTDELQPWVTWTPVCPEVEVGMSIPRPTIRLDADGDGGGTRLVEPATGTDFTESMRDYAGRRIGELQAQDLDGYVLKKRSPSCGLFGLPVYRPGTKQALRRNGRGVFAAALTVNWPELPVEEEGRLFDPLLRHNFVERVFARNRWRVFAAGSPSREGLVAFHTAHKLLVRTHGEAMYRELGKAAASFGTRPDAEVLAEYGRLFQEALRPPATTRRHLNVLYHMLGYFKKLLPAVRRKELLGVIEDFAHGLVPLVVPLTVFRLRVAEYDIAYLKGQIYLDPQPRELMLTNRIER